MRGIAHIGIAVGLVATHCAFASVWYVNKASTSTTENGHSWGTAFKTIQPAIDAASNAGGGEVWVAKGVYDEARQCSYYPGGVNSGALLIRSATATYGGFSGVETQLGQRDWTGNLTVIDGSKSRADVNAYHVVETSANALLDGFTIRGGYANGEAFSTTLGGGILFHGVDVVIRNCVLRHNNAVHGGAAVSLDDGTETAEFIGCSLLDNKITGTNGFGGTVYQDGGTINYTRCAFKNNTDRAIVIGGQGKCMISDCVFKDNAGAIYSGARDVTVCNSVFVGNHSYTVGAIRAFGLYMCDDDRRCIYSGDFRVFGCTFYNNLSQHGGALWLDTMRTFVSNSIFWSNGPSEIYITPHPSFEPPVAVTNCIVKSGYADGVTIFDQDPLFVNAAKCDFRLLPSSPAIDGGADLDALRAQFPSVAYDIEGAPRPQLAGYDLGAYEYPPSPTPDVDGNGQTEAVDIQVAINSALGLATDYLGDINHDGASDAVDIQLVINAALNL